MPRPLLGPLSRIQTAVQIECDRLAIYERLAETAAGIGDTICRASDFSWDIGNGEHTVHFQPGFIAFAGSSGRPGCRSRWHFANCAHPPFPAKKSALSEPLQNEERLRLVLEGAGLGIFDWNILTGEQIVNREWLTMLGYSPDETKTGFDDWKMLVHPADLPNALQAIEKHFEGSAPTYEAEYRLKTNSGEWKWVLARGRVVARGPGDKPLRMAGTHRDITERKEASDALQRRDAVLGAISIIAERLLTSTSWLEVLPELLAGLGQAIQASRAYVYEVYESEQSDLYARKLREWTAAGITPELTSAVGQGKSIRGDGYSRWLDVLSARQILQGNVSTFPSSEQPNLINLQIQSLIEVPIFTNGHWWGFIGFDDCTSERHWLPAEEDALKVAANVLAASIHRQQLFEAEREERRIAQAMLEMVTVLSRSLNYDSILDRLLEQVPRIVPFDGASVLLVRDNWAYVARQRGYDQDSEEAYLAMSRRSYEIRNISNLAQLMETKQVVIVTDANDNPMLEQEEISVYRSWIGAPLILEGKVNAILSIEKLEPNFYTSVHAARLSLVFQPGQPGAAQRPTLCRNAAGPGTRTASGRDYPRHQFRTGPAGDLAECGAYGSRTGRGRSRFYGNFG